MSRKAIMVEMTNEKYHETEGLSRSGAQLILKSPKKYFAKYVSKKSKSESNDTLEFGTAFHEYLLERDKFKQKYFVHKKVHGATKEGKELKASILALNKTPLAKPLMNDLRLMKKSLFELPLVESILASGETEKAIFWEDKETGMTCKTKPDHFIVQSPGLAIVFDLKTSADASFDGFSKSISNYAYHMQAAMAVDGVKAYTGIETVRFVNLVVETDAPYCADTYELDEASIERGRQDYKRALGILKKCEADKKWPSFNRELGIKTIGLPAWAQRQYEVIYG